MPGTLDVWISVPRLLSRPALLCLGAALAVVAGAGIGLYAHAHKELTLDVQGEVTSVSTFAADVGDLLAELGIEVSERDTVAPSEDFLLVDGAYVVVRHARQLEVTVDGEPSTVWTTALTAAEALSDLAARGEQVRLVASRSAGVERGAIAATAGNTVDLPVDLVAGEPVTVRVDGRTLRRDAPGADLQQLLDGLGLVLEGSDEVTVTAAARGVEVVVTRVRTAEETVTEAVPYQTVTTQDPSRYTDHRAVTTAGVAGQRELVYRVTRVDGVETARELISATEVLAPVDEQVTVGTARRPVSVPNGGQVTADATALNWAALARCESGGDPTIVSSNGKYHGLYQFLVSTWQGVGGQGLPSQATAEEQTYRAQLLYQRSGAGQWPHCGSRLFG